MSDIYTIDTPENVEFAYDIAGIGSRFLAAIIDTFIILIAEGIVLFALGMAVSSLGIAESVLSAIGAILGFIILWGYYIAFEVVWNGQSPGKRAVGLRVVRAGGRPVTLIASVIRNFIRLVDFLPAFYGIGVVAMFVDGHARRFGDLAAGTLVVRERADVTLESLTARAPAPSPAPELTIAGIHQMDDSDYALVQEFLRRRGELAREARQRLGAQLAAGLQERLGLPRAPNDEPFLEQLAAEYQLYRQRRDADL